MLADMAKYNRRGHSKFKCSRVFLLIEIELTLDFVKLSIIYIKIPRVIIRIEIVKGEEVRKLQFYKGKTCQKYQENRR